MFRLFFSDNISRHKFAIIFYLWSVVCNSLSYFMCSPSSPFNLTNLLTTHSRMFTTDHTIHITLCFLFFTTFFFVKNGKLPDRHHISLSSIFFPFSQAFGWLYWMARLSPTSLSLHLCETIFLTFLRLSKSSLSLYKHFTSQSHMRTSLTKLISKQQQQTTTTVSAD